MFENETLSVQKLGQNSVRYQQGYERRKGNTREEWLYYKYVGHNNKRLDFLMCQNTTQNITELKRDPVYTM